MNAQDAQDEEDTTGAYNLRGRRSIHSSHEQESLGVPSPRWTRSTEGLAALNTADHAELELPARSVRSFPGAGARQCAPRPKSARPGRRTPPCPPGWRFAKKPTHPEPTCAEELDTPWTHTVWCHDGHRCVQYWKLSAERDTPTGPTLRQRQARENPATPSPAPPPKRGRAEGQSPCAALPRRAAASARSAPLPLLYTVAALLVLLLVVAYWSWTTGVPPPPRVGFVDVPRQTADVHRWVDKVTELSTQFPFQRVQLWKVLRAAVNRMLLLTSQPAVFLLVSGERHRAEAACLLRAVAAAALNATGAPHDQPLHVDGAALAPLDEREAKGRLGARLDALRAGDGVAVVLLEELQLLQPRVAMLLHGFCDNDNAPRKNAVFLLSVTTAQPPPAAEAQLEEALERRLWLAWGDVLGEDIFNALLGRIAGNVASVVGEGDQLACRRART
ncbi:uncharacterized protein LOC119105316 [Pollicipes pollicipes]|uniref:uncharacterized protein LOC119105316 n=1 Tax=Pollicipes pollicipes TaxID=41117 RepID=UPI001885385D|nr:uncharacterized protein LOC119105316 [Pollicipes pollicipes]